jgi:hypothetical protein
VLVKAPTAVAAAAAVIDMFCFLLDAAKIGVMPLVDSSAIPSSSSAKYSRIWFIMLEYRILSASSHLW